MKHTRRLALAAVILLALALLVFGLVRLLGRAAETPEVLLPPPAGSSGENGVSGSALPLTLASVTPDTVLDVLAALHRADSYSRTLTAETFWETGSGTETVEVWVQGSTLRLRSGEKNLLLADGKRWLWYSDGGGVLLSGAEADGTADRYQRMMTYETLLTARPEIDEAYYTVLSGEPCIFLEYRGGAFDYRSRLYISAVTGLLMQEETYDGETCVYRLSSGPADVSTPDADVFLPPETP